MKPRLPQISALRALESASRHLSFTRAAEELHVTQSAVSHQIKHIEELWDLKMFKKTGKKIILTEAGQAVTPIIREFLFRIGSIVEELQDKQQQKPSVIRISVSPYFGFQWLVPRLRHFSHEHPNIDVLLSTEDSVNEFDPTNTEIGIHVGYGNWRHLYEEPLLYEHFFPVCSPRFLKDHPNINQPKDLLNSTLLRRDTIDILPRWRDWFRSAQVVVNTMPKGIRLPKTSFILQAARDGTGIALGSTIFTIDDLISGNLVRLFPEVSCPSNIKYFFLCALGKENDPTIQTVKSWLFREAQEFHQQSSNFLSLTHEAIAKN